MKDSRLIFTACLICAITFSCSTAKTNAKEPTAFNNNYKLENVVFDIKDNSLRQLLESQKHQTKFKKGQSLKRPTFIKERARILSLVRKNYNSDFSENKIRFEIDTSMADNKFSVVAIIQE
tara:strand:- start:342 stop:704 length:363 start_codon:yes stop_codon:yes gene_type:complete